MNLPLFDELAILFNKEGYRLYIVGGTTRDFLLQKEVKDFDFVTDATPAEMRHFLPEANYRFEKFGTIRLKKDGKHIDITTLRKEGNYIDSRHPSEIIFTKSLEEDYARRDFTINALYLDENYKIYDFCNGISDLKNGIIRFIGDPEVRIKEDPLRIIRGERFAFKLHFSFEVNTLKAMNKLRPLLDNLNPEKIKEENAKFYK